MATTIKYQKPDQSYINKLIQQAAAKGAAQYSQQANTVKEQIADAFNTQNQASATPAVATPAATTPAVATPASTTREPEIGEAATYYPLSSLPDNAGGQVDTRAQSKSDVDKLSAADRLWDSLNYSYGKKAESSNRQYDKAISQTDRSLIGRGMQRSSYGAQTLANMQNEKVEAANDIYSQQIADYEDRLYQIERDAVSDAFNEKQLAFQREQWEAQQSQWREEFDYQQKSDDQKLAMQYVMSIIQSGGTPSDDLLARAGLSRSDADAMKQQASSGGGGYYGGKSSGGGTTGASTDTSGMSTEELNAYLGSILNQSTRIVPKGGVSNSANPIATNTAKSVLAKDVTGKTTGTITQAQVNAAKAVLGSAANSGSKTTTTSSTAATLAKAASNAAINVLKKKK